MKTQHINRQTWWLLLALALLLPLVGTGYAAQETGKQATTPSLYHRLGGVYAIASVVDDFIERLLVNDTLNANPAIEDARDRVPKPGLKYHVTAFVSMATGGPIKYSGKPMKVSHAHLNITEKEWQAMVADFRKTLNKFKVPKREQEELIALVGTTKGDIVIASKK